jgi:uncharacterized protein
MALTELRPAPVALSTYVVDTDIHEMLPSAAALLPYLDPVWHRFITEFGWTDARLSSGVIPFAVPTPGRGMRADAYPEDGARPGSNLALMKRQLLDENAITIGILNGLFHPASMRVWLEFAAALAPAYNDWQIKEWLEKDSRLRGSVHIVSHDIDLAVREIDRVGPHPQIVQVFLPMVNDKLWGDPMYRPIFRAAQKHGLVVAMHHNGLTLTATGYGRYWIEYHTCLAQAHMSQITNMVCSGLFTDVPDLRIVVLEGGFSWLPYLMFRFDQQYRELRSEVPWLKRKPSDYIREHFRLATQPMEDLDARTLLQLIDMMGSDELLVFATDYPHWDFDAPSRALPPGLPEDLRQKVLWRNADKVYGLGLA